MAGYGQRHWHKVTEKPADCRNVMVVYIPTNEYATAVCGRYREKDDVVNILLEREQDIPLSECLKWCYLTDIYLTG